MKSTAIVFAALLVAAPALGDSGAGRTPYGDPASGAGRTLAGLATIVDPHGPDSGSSRTPEGQPASGAGRTLAAFPTIVDPNGPNSGVGRTWNPLEGQDVNSGAGRTLA